MTYSRGQDYPCFQYGQKLIHLYEINMMHKTKDGVHLLNKVTYYLLLFRLWKRSLILHVPVSSIYISGSLYGHLDLPFIHKAIYY